MEDSHVDADGTGERSPQGAGCSLASGGCLECISPGDIEGMQARLASSSDPPASSRAAAESSSVRVQPEAPQPGTRHVHILIAEDDQMISDLLGMILRKKGWVVETVSCGRKALARSEAEKFDLILMDLQMPDMNGLEVAQAIRRREAGEGGYVPIIALTAHARPEDRDECLSAGMDGFLLKPVSMEKLYSEVERHLPKK